MCGAESIRTYQLRLNVGSDIKLCMFPVPVVSFLNLLFMYLASCFFALLATVNSNQ